MTLPSCIVIPCIVADLESRDSATKIDQCYKTLATAYNRDFDTEIRKIVDTLCGLDGDASLPYDERRETFLNLLQVISEMGQLCNVSEIIFPNRRFQTRIDKSLIDKIQISVKQSFSQHDIQTKLQRLIHNLNTLPGIGNFAEPCCRAANSPQSVGACIHVLYSGLLNIFGNEGIPRNLFCVETGMVFPIAEDHPQVRNFKKQRNLLAKLATDLNMKDILFPSNRLQLADPQAVLAKIDKRRTETFDGAFIDEDQMHLGVVLDESYFHANSKSYYLPSGGAQAKQNRQLVQSFLHLDEFIRNSFDFKNENLHVCFFLSHGQVHENRQDEAKSPVEHRIYMEWQACNENSLGHLFDKSVTLDEQAKGKIPYLAKSTSDGKFYVDAALVEALWHHWLLAAKINGGNRHLLIVADMCQSGQLLDDLARWANAEPIQRALATANCSITVQAACRPGELARGGYFAPTWLQLNRGLFPSNKVIAQTPIEEFETPIDVALQHPCCKTVGKMPDFLSQKLILCSEESAGIVYAAWRSMFCPDPDHLASLDQILSWRGKTNSKNATLSTNYHQVLKSERYTVKEVKFFRSSLGLQLALLIESDTDRDKKWSQHVHIDRKTVLSWDKESKIPKWKLDEGYGQSPKNLKSQLVDSAGSALLQGEKTAVIVMAFYHFHDNFQITFKLKSEEFKARKGEHCSCSKSCNHGYILIICETKEKAESLASEINASEINGRKMYYAYTTKELYCDDTHGESFKFTNEMLQALWMKTAKLVEKAKQDNKDVVVKEKKNSLKLKRSSVENWWQGLQDATEDDVEDLWETMTSIPDGICRFRYFRR